MPSIPATGTNCGSSIGGIWSRRGPSVTISSKSIAVSEKSVSGNSGSQSLGPSATAMADQTKGANATTATSPSARFNRLPSRTIRIGRPA